MLLKKIGLTCASLFLAYQSFAMLKLIGLLGHEIVIEHWAINILVAVVINLTITGIFAFLGFAWPTENLLPQNYYRVKSPKRLKKFAKLLRVDWFRAFLLITFWRDQAKQKRYFDGSKDGLYVLYDNARKSEFGHLIPFILINVLCVYLLSNQLWALFIWTFSINVIFNFYPILLQREHRMRIAILVKLKKRKPRSL